VEEIGGVLGVSRTSIYRALHRELAARTTTGTGTASTGKATAGAGEATAGGAGGERRRRRVTSPASVAGGGVGS